MDILTNIGHDFWEWIGNFDPIFQMFLLRWASVLLTLLLFGSLVRFLLARLAISSLPLQVLALILGVTTGMAISLDQAVVLEEDTRNTLITAAIFSWTFVPYFLPRVLIRRHGIQSITWPLIYLLELILLSIQLVAL